jgi:hypothetical protein
LQPVQVLYCYDRASDISWSALLTTTCMAGSATSAQKKKRRLSFRISKVMSADVLAEAAQEEEARAKAQAAATAAAAAIAAAESTAATKRVAAPQLKPEEVSIGL